MNQRPQDTPQYYMPYDSDADTEGKGSSRGSSRGNKTDEDGYTTGTDDGEDTDYDDSNLPESEDARIRREEDPRYAIIRTAGPSFNTSALQLKYMEHQPGAEYNPSTNISSLSSLTYLDPPKTTLTSLFSVKSRNRDQSVWPSPFNFEIKTPRVYKNVTKFQLVQLSFPNNTLALTNVDIFTSSLVIYLEQQGFSPTCIDACLDTATMLGTDFTSIGVAEQGRLNGAGEQMLTKLEIANGLYSNDALAAELTTQANNTPPLNLISYTDFNAAFKATKDPFLLFNEPGDNFHSILTPQRYGQHTKETIMNTYFTQQHVNSFPIITDTIAFTTYYFPVLKELAATRAGHYFINVAGTGLSKDNALRIIVDEFQGLDSTDYYKLCSTNRSTLESFRRNLTFEKRNINKYVWSFDSFRNRFQCSHDSLHTSLKNDINGKYAQFYSQQLQLVGLTAQSFTTLKTTQANNSAIFDNLASYVSTQIGTYFPGEGNYQYLGGDFHSTQIGGAWTSRNFSALAADAVFNAAFNFTNIFGQQYNSFAGKTLSFTNFTDFHSTLSSYYTLTTSTNNFLSSFYGGVHSRHHTYVSTKYSAVLPSEMIATKSYNNGHGVPASFVGKRFTYKPGESLVQGIGDDPCVAECQAVIRNLIVGYYSCLPVNNIVGTLWYRLGLDVVPTTFASLSTYLSTISSGNVNFFLQINNEQSFNNMDVSMPEDYSITNETTGQVKLMSAKILTAGVGAGEESQTCIQNPILFTNTLGRLDKLQFKIYADDQYLTPMWRFLPQELALNEWDATFQIDEEIGFANRNTGWGLRPTVPVPNNPNAMPYLAFSAANNPNNK